MSLNVTQQAADSLSNSTNLQQFTQQFEQQVMDFTGAASVQVLAVDVPSSGSVGRRLTQLLSGGGGSAGGRKAPQPSLLKFKLQLAGKAVAVGAGAQQQELHESDGGAPAAQQQRRQLQQDAQQAEQQVLVRFALLFGSGVDAGLVYQTMAK